VNVNQDDLSQLSGLEQSALIAPSAQRRSRRRSDLLVEVEEGRAVFEGNNGRICSIRIGTVHGGFAATFLDSACADARFIRASPQQVYTTLELAVAYHRAITAETLCARRRGSPLRPHGLSEGRLTAEGVSSHRRRRRCRL
jgi:acyl-coenzyme A thioesterase PaaI-like protein